MLSLAHLWAALCAFGIASFLFTAGRSAEFRFLIGPSEADRSFNFQVVSVFLFALALDLGSVPVGIESFPHAAAISLACVAGTLALSMFVWRVLKWKV